MPEIITFNELWFLIIKLKEWGYIKNEEVILNGWADKLKNITEAQKRRFHALQINHRPEELKNFLNQFDK